MRIAAKSLLLGVLVFAAGVRADALNPDSSDNVQLARGAVVSIQVTFFVYSYEHPWNRPAVQRASGTGFIIAGNRILTNAHVVSRANTVRVQRPDQRTDYSARVLFLGHDCDLALLGVEDPAFFEGSRPLEIGENPELNTELEVIGFPIGGDRVSITRGIVSRLGMDVYSHSRIDHHLTIQVDAAINPGNSGGPALQNGRVIGVAFQTLRQGENLGYLIPPVVLRRFLEDTADGSYAGYIEFGVLDFPTRNPTLRTALGMNGSIASPNTGVLITSIVPGASAEGHLQTGDVLLSLMGHVISESGDIEVDGQLQPYSEAIDNLPVGAGIQAEVWRDGRRQALQFPARGTDIIDFQRKNYDAAPSYLVAAGLVFQPLDADLLEAYGQQWVAAGRSDILYRYSRYLSNALYEQARVFVILTRRLADRVNLHADSSVGGIVQSVNGRRVSNFAAFVEAMDDAIVQGPFVTIRFFDQQVPLVLRSSDIEAANMRIAENYGVRRDRFVGPDR